jgi:hypothetical protein
VLYKYHNIPSLTRSLTAPQGFLLDTEIRKGLFEFGDGSTIKVELLFDEGAGAHLYDPPCQPISRSKKTPKAISACARHPAAQVVAAWFRRWGGGDETCEAEEGIQGHGAGNGGDIWVRDSRPKRERVSR